MVVCLYVCMPLDIASHASFPRNLGASGWMSRVWTLHIPAFPPWSPEEVLLSECVASTSPGKASSRRSSPHLFSGDWLTLPTSLLPTLSPEATLQLPVFVNCGLQNILVISVKVLKMLIPFEKQQFHLKCVRGIIRNIGQKFICNDTHWTFLIIEKNRTNKGLGK